MILITISHLTPKEVIIDRVDPWNSAARQFQQRLYTFIAQKIFS
ncbi:hypothetical protein [Aphanothece hegewaldii]|nr:hypothetical protein [Aphanothece hegewaldii]